MTLRATLDCDLPRPVIAPIRRMARTGGAHTIRVFRRCAYVPNEGQCLRQARPIVLGISPK
jgi:hypothetical protein